VTACDHGDNGGYLIFTFLGDPPKVFISQRVDFFDEVIAVAQAFLL